MFLCDWVVTEYVANEHWEVFVPSVCVDTSLWRLLFRRCESIQTTETLIEIIALNVFVGIDRGSVCPMVSQHCGNYDLAEYEIHMFHSRHMKDHAYIDCKISSWFVGSR